MIFNRSLTKGLTHIRIEDHVHSLGSDVILKLTKELQDIIGSRVIGQPPQFDTLPLTASEVLYLRVGCDGNTQQLGELGLLVHRG